MNNIGRYIKPKTAISVTIFISIVIWCIVLYFTKTKLILNWAAFKHLPTVITIDMVLYWFFVKWIWKWQKLQGWLVPFPNLNGAWKGRLKSLWQDPQTGKGVADVDIILSIKQTLLAVNCVMKTAESESKSYVASFLINSDTGQKQLVYSYFNKPKPSVRERSIPHDGTVLLNIVGKCEAIKLEGEYWTSRKSNGEIALEKTE